MPVGGKGVDRLWSRRLPPLIIWPVSTYGSYFFLNWWTFSLWPTYTGNLFHTSTTWVTVCLPFPWCVSTFWHHRQNISLLSGGHQANHWYKSGINGRSQYAALRNITFNLPPAGKRLLFPLTLARGGGSDITPDIFSVPATYGKKMAISCLVTELLRHKGNTVRPFLREMAVYCILESDIDHDEAHLDYFRSEPTCLTPPQYPLTFWPRSGQGQVQVKVKVRSGP